VAKVFSDLLVAADSGQMLALCLLDLTAAFDTVDHDLLLLWLEHQFGLCGIVLAWLRSYLSGRMFRIVYNGWDVKLYSTIPFQKARCLVRCC